MEYINGKETGECFDCALGRHCQYFDCVSQAIVNELNLRGIFDLSFGNLIECDGDVYIVDAVE